MKILTFWLQPQDILMDSGPLSKAKEILHRKINWFLKLKEAIHNSPFFPRKSFAAQE